MPKYKIMTRVVTYVSGCLVVIWIVGAVVGLYFWRSDYGRLVLLSVLTLFFTLLVATLTTARRHDVFSATAAYVFSFFSMPPNIL